MLTSRISTRCQSIDFFIGVPSTRSRAHRDDGRGHRGVRRQPVDATMLSGETTTGIFSAQAVQIMAAISINADVAGDCRHRCLPARFHAAPIHNVGVRRRLRVGENCRLRCLTLRLRFRRRKHRRTPRAVSTYRPPCPVLVATADQAVSSQTSEFFAQHPHWWRVWTPRSGDQQLTSRAPLCEGQWSRGARRRRQRGGGGGRRRGRRRQ